MLRLLVCGRVAEPIRACRPDALQPGDDVGRTQAVAVEGIFSCARARNMLYPLGPAPTTLMKRCLLPLTLLGLIQPIFAQEQDMVTLRFLSYPKSANPEPVELLIGDSSTIKVEAPTNALSQTYQIKRLASWSLGKMEAAKNEGEMPSFTSYGSAPALASSEQLILLIRNGKDNKDGLRVIAIDNTTTHFGRGQFFFMNQSKAVIVGKLGGTEFTLQPGAYTIMESGEVIKREHDVPLLTEFLARKEHETRPFFSSMWPVNDKARSLIFFGHDSKNDLLRMHTIRDYVP